MIVLSRSDVKVNLPFGELAEALRAAIIHVSEGTVSTPARISAFVPGGQLCVMPGHISGCLASKVVSIFPANDSVGLPTHQAVVLVFDELTGEPLALMDGNEITAARTAVSTAIAVSALTEGRRCSLAILGAGVQARSHLAAIPRLANVSEISIAARDRARAESLAQEFGAKAATSFEQACNGADVVALCTSAYRPITQASWFRAGTIVISIGTSAGGPELDPETVAACEPGCRLAGSVREVPGWGTRAVGPRPSQRSRVRRAAQRSEGHSRP